MTSMNMTLEQVEISYYNYKLNQDFCWNSANTQLDLAFYLSKIIVTSCHLLCFVASCRLWPVVLYGKLSPFEHNAPYTIMDVRNN